MQVASILRTILSVVIAYQLSSDLAPVLQKNIPITQSDVPLDLIYRGIAFLVLLLGSRYILSFLFGFINHVFSLPLLSFVNHFGGLLFGIIQSVIICIVVVNLLYVLPWDVGREAVRNSSYAQEILDIVPSLKLRS